MIVYRPKCCSPYNKIVEEIVKTETRKEDTEYTIDTKVNRRVFLNRREKNISIFNRNIQNIIRIESI